jgi:hypothetical protein
MMMSMMKGLRMWWKCEALLAGVSCLMIKCH